MDLQTLKNAIDAEVAAREQSNEINFEIGRRRLAGEDITPELIADADAAFQSMLDAQNAMIDAIEAAKAAGVSQAQNMTAPLRENEMTIKKMYRQIRVAGGTLY